MNEADSAAIFITVRNWTLIILLVCVALLAIKFTLSLLRRGERIDPPRTRRRTALPLESSLPAPQEVEDPIECGSCGKIICSEPTRTHVTDKERLLFYRCEHCGQEVTTPI